MLRNLILLSLSEIHRLVYNMCVYHQSYALGALHKCHNILKLTNESLERVYFRQIIVPKLKRLQADQELITSVICILHVATKLKQNPNLVVSL